tara:strand:+ start:528 stop:848 length:321 start_codon:yes stop_codon:yes gene_type:complete
VVAAEELTQVVLVVLLVQVEAEQVEMILVQLAQLEQQTLVAAVGPVLIQEETELLVDQAFLLFNIQVLKEHRVVQFHVSHVRHNIYLIVQQFFLQFIPQPLSPWII